MLSQKFPRDSKAFMIGEDGIRRALEEKLRSFDPDGHGRLADRYPGSFGKFTHREDSPLLSKEGSYEAPSNFPS